MPAIVKMSKEEAQKRLSDVPVEYAFFCHDGRRLHNLAELRDALATMSNDVFTSHSNREKRDFSNWVRDVIKDEPLARQLRRAGTLAQTRKLTEQRVAFLSSRI